VPGQRRVSIQTLVLGCEGLSKAVRDDRQVIAMLEQARLDDAAVVTSAVTLVEARDPRTPQPRFDWVLSRIEILPVTERIARQAARLLAQASLHGHRYALDALVAATALLAPAPAVILTSDPDDMTALLPHRVRIVKV
jgi:predicted nucleic acid-binding protein